MVLGLPWDCSQSNISSASALGAIDQLQQGMNFHSEIILKSQNTKRDENIRGKLSVIQLVHEHQTTEFW